MRKLLYCANIKKCSIIGKGTVKEIPPISAFKHKQWDKILLVTVPPITDIFS
jgi:hypothetical protein